MSIIEAFDQFQIEDCYTIGSNMDIKRVNQRINDLEKNECKNIKVAFGDVLEGCVFDRCISSLTVPSMSKVTAMLTPVGNKDYRIYDQFSLIQTLVIQDMLKKEVKQLTLIKENVKESPIYIADFNTIDKKNKNVTVDYLFFANRLEANTILLKEITGKIDIKQNSDYLCIINRVKEVGIHSIDKKKMLVLKN